MIKNETGNKIIFFQKKRRAILRKITYFLIILSLLALLLPHWYKLLFIIGIFSAYQLDRFSRKVYEDILYSERDKERVALYLRKSLPSYMVWVNPQVCEPYPDLLLIGEKGIFAIILTADIEFAVKKSGEGEVSALKKALGSCLQQYSYELLILLSKSVLFRPAKTDTLVFSSRYALLNHIRRSKNHLSPEEIVLVRHSLEKNQAEIVKV